MTFVPSRLERRAGWAAILLGLIGILAATLTPIPGNAAAAGDTPSWCLVCGTQGGVDVTLNVILFLPFALGLRLAGMPFSAVAALSIALTLFVETMQATVIVGRDPSLSDLLTNTTGGVLGAALAPRLRRLAHPSHRTARGLVLSWAAVWLATMLAAAWLLQPMAPGGAVRAIWGMEIPGYASFTGTVLDATVNGRRSHESVIPDSLGLREGILVGRVRLGYDAVIGRPADRWAPVVTFVGPSRPFGFFESGDALILQLPINAERLRLANAALRLDHGRPAAAGELVRVSGGARGRAYWIAAASGDGQRSAELRLSPSFGWSLLIPFQYALGAEAHLLTALWLIGWLFPLGYWARHAAPLAASGSRAMRAPRRRPLAWGIGAVTALELGAIPWGIGAVTAIGLGAIPWLAGYPPVHWSEWAAAAAGLGLGWAAAARAAYLGERCASPSGSGSS